MLVRVMIGKRTRSTGDLMVLPDPRELVPPQVVRGILLKDAGAQVAIILDDLARVQPEEVVSAR